MSKTILVTEAQVGAGPAIVQMLAESGYSVIAAMPNGSVLNNARTIIHQLPNVEVADIDVRQDTSVSMAVKKILKKYGQIDGLICNTGHSCADTIDTSSVDHTRDIFETELFGLMRICQAVLPGMYTRQCGLIINLMNNINTCQTFQAIPHQLAAHSRNSLAKVLRHRIKPYNIEILSVWSETFAQELKTEQKDELDSQRDTHKQKVANTVAELVKMKKGTRPSWTKIVLNG